MNNNYYCFPDIHGCSDTLKMALDFVYAKNPSGGKIIFLGDYIDRGPDDRGVLQLVMNPPENWEFVCLMGNHELMLLEAYRNNTQFYDIKSAKNIAGFGPNDIVQHYEIMRDIPKDVIGWLYTLKTCHIEDKNVFAHAFYDDTKSPEDQIMSDCVWQRMSDHETWHSHIQGLFLTHGHTPRKHGPILSKDRVNLDAGGVFYGKFVIAEYHKDIQGPTAYHEFFSKNYLDK